MTFIQEIRECPVCGEPHGMVTLPELATPGFRFTDTWVPYWTNGARCPTSGLMMYARLNNHKVEIGR